MMAIPRAIFGKVMREIYGAFRTQLIEALLGWFLVWIFGGGLLLMLTHT